MPDASPHISDAVARVATTADELDALCRQLEHSAVTWDARAEELLRRRSDHAAEDAVARVQFGDAVRAFAAKIVKGGQGAKRPTSPAADPEVTSAVGGAFASAIHEAREQAERARALRAHGETLARAVDLTGAITELSALLASAVPVVQRFLELRDGAGLVAKYAAPVLRNDDLDVWAPVFEGLIGSRHRAFDLDGRVLALAWLHRAGVEMPEHVADIDSGKLRIEVALGVDGEERLDDQVSNFKSEVSHYFDGARLRATGN